MADLLTALDQVLATPGAQALSLDSDVDRARLRELVVAEVAAPAAQLTVVQALAIASVAEFINEDGQWCQFRADRWSRRWRPDSPSGPRWSEWGWPYDMTTDEADSPCRLVPIAEADASPEARGRL